MDLISMSDVHHETNSIYTLSFCTHRYEEMYF